MDRQKRWGCLGSQEIFSNRFPALFAAGRRDRTHKTPYYRARYYDTDRGRFVQRDPLGIVPAETNRNKGKFLLPRISI